MENLRRQPLHPDISEDLIKTLVHRFYDKVRDDAILGPIFNNAIREEQWPEHLEKMCAFWSSIMLMSGRYHGNPMMAHMRHKTIRPEHFAHWLDLFRHAAGEVAPCEIANLFVARAENIARSLQMGLFYRPGARPAPHVEGAAP